MSQVIVEFTKIPQTAPINGIAISSYDADVEEITSSASNQATTTLSVGLPDEVVVTVINNGTDAIWVNFGAAATAGTPSRFVPANTIRDFGGIPLNVAVNVINDS